MSGLLGAGVLTCRRQASARSHPGRLVDPATRAECISAIRAAWRAADVDLDAWIDTRIAECRNPPGTLAALGATRITFDPRLWTRRLRLAGALVDGPCLRTWRALTVKGSGA